MQQYSIAKGIRPDKLAIEVNRLIADGWTPHGSPQWDFNGNVWIQAMVKATAERNGDVPLREPRRR